MNEGQIIELFIRAAEVEVSELTFAEVHALLKCDPETGKLFWKERPVEMFKSGRQTAEHNCNAWNRKNAGKEAFTAISGGYAIGALFHRNYKAHRVIWLLVHGEWPNEDIDHINGDRSDNRIINLRAASRADNMRNSCMRSDNTSGVMGVHWDKRRGKWCARIECEGSAKHLGYFRQFDAAVASRKRAETELGFHHNHGRTSR